VAASRYMTDGAPKCLLEKKMDDDNKMMTDMAEWKKGEEQKIRKALGKNDDAEIEFHEYEYGYMKTANEKRNVKIELYYAISLLEHMDKQEEPVCPEIEGATTELDCLDMQNMFWDAYFYTMTQLDDCPRVDLTINGDGEILHKAFTYANGYGKVDDKLSFYNQVTIDGSKNALWKLIHEMETESYSNRKLRLEISTGGKTVVAVSQYMKDGVLKCLLEKKMNGKNKIMSMVKWKKGEEQKRRSALSKNDDAVIELHELLTQYMITANENRNDIIKKNEDNHKEVLEPVCKS